MRSLMFLMLLFVPLQSYGQVLINLSNSVVKIGNDKGIGTSFVINEDQNSYYLLSSGHTIHYGGGGKLAEGTKAKLIDTKDLRFHLGLYHNGKEQIYKDIVEVLTYSYDGREELCYHINDLALLRFSKEEIKNYDKPLVSLQLANNTSDFIKGNIVWTCGHPNGGWPTIYRGTVLKPYNSSMIVFYPPSTPGRSGSPLMNHNATQVMGIVTYTNAHVKKDGTAGAAIESGAIPYWHIQKFLDDYYETLKKE